MNYSLAYSSKQYEEREYTMTVRVYTEITFFREEIATSSVKFRITKQLNGDIAIRQKEAKGRVVSSLENVEFEINLHDPSGKKKLFSHWRHSESHIKAYVKMYRQTLL